MIRYITACFVSLMLLCDVLRAQSQSMTLSEAIVVARNQSVAALEAKHAFISVYWSYRAYKATFLPSLSIYGDLMNYDRSLTLLQSYQDGSFNYAATNNLRNSVGVRASQNLSLTGGSVSLYSDLNRLDQFGHDRSLTWYSQPITISYSQPLFAYNKFKWDKKIQPQEYEHGRRRYIESMEEITVNSVVAFFNLILERMRLDVAKFNYENTSEMYRIAKERLNIGTVTRDECLQLELRMLNDSISINEQQVKVREAQMAFNSVLGYSETQEIVPILEDALPDLMMDYDMVIDRALNNSIFGLNNEINLLNAESDIAKAKADRGVSMSVYARFGLSQKDNTFNGAYRNPLDQEIVGMTFNIPIFDWGLGRGKVQKAKAAQEVVKAQVQQAENDFRRVIFTAVGQFNNQRNQCQVSSRARHIASERLDLMVDKFRSGNATVTDLNTAQSENDTAIEKYVTDISNYWKYYYTLRQYTLYDFIKQSDIDVDVMEMVEE